MIRFGAVNTAYEKPLLRLFQASDDVKVFRSGFARENTRVFQRPYRSAQRLYPLQI